MLQTLDCGYTFPASSVRITITITRKPKGFMVIQNRSIDINIWEQKLKMCMSFRRFMLGIYRCYKMNFKILKLRKCNINFDINYSVRYV